MGTYRNKLYALTIRLADGRSTTWYFDRDAQVESTRLMLKKHDDLITTYSGAWRQGNPPTGDAVSNADEFRSWLLDLN